jgi:hypothetical protein
MVQLLAVALIFISVTNRIQIMEGILTVIIYTLDLVNSSIMKIHNRFWLEVTNGTQVK